MDPRTPFHPALGEEPPGLTVPAPGICSLAVSPLELAVEPRGEPPAAALGDSSAGDLGRKAESFEGDLGEAASLPGDDAMAAWGNFET